MLVRRPLSGGMENRRCFGPDTYRSVRVFQVGIRIFDRCCLVTMLKNVGPGP